MCDFDVKTTWRYTPYGTTYCTYYARVTSISDGNGCRDAVVVVVETGSIEGSENRVCLRDNATA